MSDRNRNRSIKNYEKNIKEFKLKLSNSALKHLNYEDLTDLKIAEITTILKQFKKKDISKNKLMVDITDEIYTSINHLLILKRALISLHIKLYSNDPKKSPPKLIQIANVEHILKKDLSYNEIVENQLEAAIQALKPDPIKREGDLLSEIQNSFDFKTFKENKNKYYSDQDEFLKYLNNEKPELFYKHLSTAAKLTVFKIFNEIE